MKRGASAREQSAISVAQAFLSAASPLLSKVGAALKSGAAFLVPIAPALFGAEQVKIYEGTLTIPPHEHMGRETEPPLFANSTLTGMYPFTTYVMPFKADGPKPRTPKASDGR